MASAKMSPRKLEEAVQEELKIEAAKQFDNLVGAYGSMVLANALEARIEELKARKDVLQTEVAQMEEVYGSVLRTCEPLKEMEAYYKEQMRAVKRQAKVSEKNMKRLNQIVQIARRIELSSGQ